MWMLSEPGSEAEHCFRRVQQSEYHQEEDGYDVLKHMPNVSPRMLFAVPLCSLTMHNSSASLRAQSFVQVALMESLFKQ